MRTTVTACVLSWGLATNPAVGQGTVELDGLIEEALAKNPDLEVLRQRWLVELARVPQAGALQDPLLRFDLLNVPFSDLDLDSTPMSGRQIGLSQSLPWWGKRAARQRFAEQTAAVAESAMLDRQGTIVHLVKSAYFTIAFLDRALDITRENQTLLRDVIRIVRTKYAVGKGVQTDVLKAQVSLSSLGVELIRLKQQRGRAQAQLNSVLNRPPHSAVGRPTPIAMTAFAGDADRLQKTAFEHRSLLRGIEEDIDRWSVAEDLARLQRRPDFEVSVAYRQRDFSSDPVQGSDFISAGVRLNLPIHAGRKQDRQVQEAGHRRRVAVARYEAAKHNLLQRIRSLHVDIEANREQAELFAAVIIPQAKQSLAAAMVGYQVDKVDFLALLDSQVVLLNLEVAYYRHLAEHEKALAALEAEVGKRLF